MIPFGINCARLINSRHFCSRSGAKVQPDPTTALEARDMLKCVNAVIEALPERTREIFIRFPIHGQRRSISTASPMLFA